MTLSLPGFNTIKREDIQLTSGFTATVNIDLTVGQLAKQSPSACASPVVDVQNVRQTAVMTREVVDTIPTGKEFKNLATLVPGMVSRRRSRQRGIRSSRIPRQKIRDAAATGRHAAAVFLSPAAAAPAADG